MNSRTDSATVREGRVRTWARRLRNELQVWALVARHPGTPRTARLVLIMTLAYAASPIDLIPDFIPVLGHVDDLLVVPLGLALAARLVPDDVLRECRARVAAGSRTSMKRNLRAAVVVVALWLLAATGAAALLVGHLHLIKT